MRRVTRLRCLGDRAKTLHFLLDIPLFLFSVYTTALETLFQLEFIGMPCWLIFSCDHTGVKTSGVS
jgi:hypothetical protein